MISVSSVDKDSPIPLDDNIQTFDDWADMVFTYVYGNYFKILFNQQRISRPKSSLLDLALPPLTPVARKLGQNHPLRQRLDLLCLCHKYESTEFENNLLSVILPMSSDRDILMDHITPIDPELTPYRLLDISEMLNQPKIGSVARNLILEKIWDRYFHMTQEQAVEALMFGERVGDKQIVGAAYYRVMLWLDRPHPLTPSISTLLGDYENLYQENLRRGKERCSGEWDRIFAEWGSGEDEALSAEWLGQTWLALVKSNFPQCDVVGKVSAGLNVLLRNSGGSGGWDWKRVAVKAQLDSIKFSIYECFLPEAAPPVELEPTGAGAEEDVLLQENA